jgi:hypothetical protein
MRGKTQKRGMVLDRWVPRGPTRQEAREKRIRLLLLVAASAAEVTEGAASEKAMRSVRFRVLSARSARVQTEPGWAERPCPCTLREARVCPVHEAGRMP